MSSYFFLSVRNCNSERMKVLLLAIIGLSVIAVSEAGFRCFFGDWACSAGCKALGRSTGTCDGQDNCQ